jgi:cyclopropane-fatty-acyl-phospholipid synthase
MIFGIEKGKVLKYLEQISNIPFTVKLPDEEPIKLGNGESQFTVTVNRPLKKTDLLHSTSLALGEAYMNRDIEVEGDLFAALNIALSQIEKFAVDSHSLKKLLHSSTSAKNQKKEVSSHYDIGNDFYSLWLGNTMNYSCAYFKNEKDTLDEAQENKIDHILSKLNIKDGMSLLDIGCGWGYLLLEAAKRHHIHGVGITLSEEQAKGFQKKIEEEGLQDHLEVKIMDYRELKKSDLTFDRVVSVGMLEHVGRANYELFFENVDAVLKPQGLFLLHYISALKEHPGDPWIKKYIFPGGVIPSLREIIQICGDHRFYTLDVESLRQHYVKTLLCWRENYLQAMDQVKMMFDDQFIRMWELYLCSCAASFNNGVIDLHQILLSKGPKNDMPLTRCHLYE